MKVVQGLLGHSDIAITLGLYSHLLPSMQKDIVEKWEGVFGHDDKGILIPFSIRKAADEP